MVQEPKKKLDMEEPQEEMTVTLTLDDGSQNMWAKLCVREGNSPDRPLRSPS